MTAPATDRNAPTIVLVTGPSGAGRSTAINALEDLGYEVIDNLPLSLLPRLLDGPPPSRPLALGLDVRNRDLGVTLHSFSYKRGLPRGLDIVMDCRFLRNPHWDPDLRALDGRDAAVADYVAADARFDPFFERGKALIDLLLPAHKDEGKTHLSIGFGCTGGQHRSVAITERMASALAQDGWQVSKRHREIERRDAQGNKGRQV